MKSRAWLTAPWIPIVVGVGVMLTPAASSGQPQILAPAPSPTVQTPLHLRVNEQEAQRFDTVLESLSEREKVAIVAEGVPLHPFGAQTPLDTIAALPPSLVGRTAAESEASIDPVVSRSTTISRSYDYDLTRVGAVLVLRKCYSDSGDLPDVPIDEAAAFLRRAASLIKSLNQNPIHDGGELSKCAAQFVGGLNEDQLSHLKQLHLTLSDLNEDQREQARRFTRFFHVEVPFQDINDAAIGLQECGESGSFLNWNASYPRDSPILGITPGTIRSGQLNFISLTENDGTTPQSKKVVAERESSLQAPVILRGVTTLGALAEEVKLETGGKTTVSVAKPLSGKRLCVYGMRFASSEAVMRAAAAAYGLKLVTLKDGTRALTGPPIPSVENIGDLHDALAALLPDCCRRALHIDASNARYASFNLARERGDEDAATYFRYISDIGNRPQNMRLEGIRRLLYAESKRPGSPNVHTLVSALSPDEQDAITAILMKRALSQFSLLTQVYQPPYLSDWSQLCLGGGISQDEKGKTLYHLFLCLPNRNDPSKMHTTNGLVTPGE